MSKHTCESVLGCNNRACPVHYPATQPDHDAFLAGPVEAKPAAYPKDQRIAELESELLEMARTQAAGLAREEKLFKELGDARAECERQREYHEAAFRIVERDTATIRRLEAAAGRMRAALEQLVLPCARQDYSMAKLDDVVRSIASKALAETDAGTRALAVIEAARGFVKYIGAHMDWHPPSDLLKALADWDQGAKPSGGKGDGK